jgi:hypothetical protein
VLSYAELNRLYEDLGTVRISLSLKSSAEFLSSASWRMQARTDTAPQAAGQRCAELRRSRVGLTFGPHLVHGVLTPSMRTTGARDERATSAARERCPRSCMPAVVRLCCCTYCCTELTFTYQASATGLSPTSLSQLVLASSSRSQRAMRCTIAFTLAHLRGAVRGRPPTSTSVSGRCYSFSYSPVRPQRQDAAWCGTSV